MTRPTFLSLFSGIGGLDLGLERAGWSCVGQVEIDPFCRRVLAKHWPDVPRWGDIREVDPDDLPRADLVAGGFPCQPVSTAGKRLAQADERWLWPEFARIVRHLRPGWVLVENVPGLLVRGMGDVLGDLAACGYDAEWDCIPASAVGAPHRRDRVWIVAYPSGQGRERGGIRGRIAPDGEVFNAEPAYGGSDVPDPECQQLWDEPGRRNGQGGSGTAVAGDNGAAEPLADPNGVGWIPGRHDPGQQQEVAEPVHCSMGDSEGERRRAGLRKSRTGPVASPRIFLAEPGDTGWWRSEPDVGRVAYGVPQRVDRLRALGNAVVPQVAELIGRRILEAAA